MGIVTVGVAVSCKLGLITKQNLFNNPSAERYSSQAFVRF